VQATTTTHGTLWLRPKPVPRDLNGPVDRAYPRPPPDFTERPILHLLTEAAEAAAPGAIALVGAAESLSYIELIDRISRIADHVAALVPEDEAVATLLPNSPTGFAAILACLAAGRVCIVPDAGQPPARIAAMLGDARPGAVLLPDAAAAGFDVPARIRRLGIAKALTARPRAARRRVLDPDEPALVHYTSGSTGRPKGVVISSRAALRRALVYIEAWHIGPADRFLSTTQPSSNSGFCANLAALCVGARVLTHALAAEGITSLFDLARRESLTVLHALPSVARLLFGARGAQAAFSRLRMLNSSGESLVRSDMAAWRELLPPGCHIAHGYASTEAMVVATCFVPPRYAGDEARLPAGFPLADQEYMLLDESGRPVAAGEVGELVLRSRHVACGEWQDGGCVPGRFAPDPSQPGSRILRTGDLMRFGSDGMLRFVSRADRQIKINGVRIEPAEIEMVLRRTPGVRDAAVIARPGAEGTDLFAHVAAPRARHAALRSQLRENIGNELPSAARSIRIVMVDRMPYLPTGKVDLNALGKPRGRPVAPPAPAGDAGASEADRQRLRTLIATTLKLPVNRVAESSTMHNTPRWDSLRHVMLMMRIEAQYGIALTDGEMAAATSVASIRRVLHARNLH
jgi:amino acid adenylation domain-containing protein